MQEFDVVLQTAVKIRTELWSMIAHLPKGEPFAEQGIPLMFHEKWYIIAWKDQNARFTPSTFRLLQQLWFAPGHFLSKEDVRQDVNEDEEASDGAVRLVIFDARQEIKNAEFPYEIETLWGKGYKLNKKETNGNL